MKTSSFASSVKLQTKHLESSWVDLHMHSTYSDGEHSVEELLAMGQKKGLRAMSITDHDTLDGYLEAKDLADKYSIELVSGVEISVFIEDSELHILGYLFDARNLNLNLKLSELQEKRKIRAQNIVNKLAQKGAPISLDRVFEKARGSSIGRPHIAEVLVEEEYVANFAEAFDKYIHADFVKEFDVYKPTPAEAIRLLTEAGGVAVLAHPAKYNRDDLIPKLVEWGLHGIEVYTPGTDRKQSNHYKKLAKSYNLICSGGSDFHSKSGGNKNGVGSVKVPQESLDQLKEASLKICT